MQPYNLENLEIELKKRCKYPYIWGRKQNNSWDYQTNFVYKINDFEILQENLKSFSQDLQNYALNRWFNFWSAQAVEQIFNKNENVTRAENKFDKNKDFFINSIPFDHKSTVLPKKYNNAFEINDENEQELLTWLYMNQSQQGRKHLKNRLFLVFYDKNTNDHWKLKAELTLIDKVVDEYLSSFDELKLIKLKIDNNDIVTDLIWVQPNLLS